LRRKSNKNSKVDNHTLSADRDSSRSKIHSANEQGSLA